MIKGAVLQLPFLSSNHYLGVKENRNLANRRRRRQKPNQMVWIMLAITMVCVVIVFAIVMAQKEKGALVKQAKAVTKDMVYENAYIVSNDDGRLIFICDGDLYRARVPWKRTLQVSVILKSVALRSKDTDKAG